MSTEEFWKAFLEEKRLPLSTEYVEAFFFGSSKKSANSLLKLVLEGKKRATSSSKAVYDISGEAPPKAGDYSIVTDFSGEPFCVIRTTAVKVLPFREMTFERCKREGEDFCLESWRKNHMDFFSWEAKEEGYTFSEDMEILFEDFEVVYKKQEQSKGDIK